MAEKEMHKAVCADCGKECEVPFKPDPTRPVYCRECWSKRRGQRRRYQTELKAPIQILIFQHFFIIQCKLLKTKIEFTRKFKETHATLSERGE